MTHRKAHSHDAYHMFCPLQKFPNAQAVSTRLTSTEFSTANAESSARGSR